MAEASSSTVPPPPPPPPPMSNPIPDSELVNVEDDEKLRMKVRAPKFGQVLYPTVGQRVDIVYSSYKEDYSCIEYKVATSFILGSDHCIPAFDLSVRKMKEGEVAVVKASAEYAFGIFGHRPKPLDSPKKSDEDSQKPVISLPYYAPNETIIFDISLLYHYEFDHRAKMSHKLRVQYTRTLLERGNQLFVLKEYKRAIELYATGVIYLTDYEVKSITQQEFKSIADLQEKLYLPMMSCYDKIGNIKRCQKAAEKVLEINCMNWKALYQKGRCMAIQGEKKGGLEYMEQALGLSPSVMEIRTAIDAVRAEIQNQATTRELRKKGKKKGKKRKGNTGHVSDEVASNDDKKAETVLDIKPSFEAKTSEDGTIQAVTAADQKENENEMVTTNGNVNIHAEESIDLKNTNTEEKVAEIDIINPSVQCFMEDIIDQVVLVTEEKQKQAELFIMNQSIGNIMEGMINQVVSTIEREEKEAELVEIKQTIGNILEDIVDQAVTSSEEKKKKAEMVIFEESVGRYVDDVIKQALSSAEKMENDSEMVTFYESIEEIVEDIIDEVKVTIDDETNESEMAIIAETVDNSAKDTYNKAILTAIDIKEDAEIAEEKEKDVGNHFTDRSIATYEKEAVLSNLTPTDQTESYMDDEREDKPVSCWHCFKCKGLRKRIGRFFRRFRRN